MEIRASTGSLNGEEGRGDGMKRDAWEQEFRAVWRREERFLRQYECPPKSPLDQKVSELAPEKLIETLRAAFEKAVAVVFDKGSGVVIRENRRAEQQRTYQINAYAATCRRPAEASGLSPRRRTGPGGAVSCWEAPLALGWDCLG